MVALKLARHLLLVVLAAAFIGVSGAFAQNILEFREILSQNPISADDSGQSPKWVYPSEFKTLLAGSVRFYQICIATQDMSVCSFTPSCSHFAFQALKNVPPFLAVLLASDRLLRDNPLAAGHYRINPKTGRFADPLAFYLNLIKRQSRK